MQSFAFMDSAVAERSRAANLNEVKSSLHPGVTKVAVTFLISVLAGLVAIRLGTPRSLVVNVSSDDAGNVSVV